VSSFTSVRQARRTSKRTSEQTKPGFSGPLTLHLTVPTGFPHANAVDESSSFFSSSLRPLRHLFSFNLLGPSLSSSSSSSFFFLPFLLSIQRRFRNGEGEMYFMLRQVGETAAPLLLVGHAKNKILCLYIKGYAFA